MEKQGTENKIVGKALEMFNAAGVEYVGMRELASALDMRIGNLTYYFPTKDHLVDRLALDLAAENNRTIVASENITMAGFVEMLQHVFHNHIKYRCLMLSFVHLMKRNPIISKRYEKTQVRRNDAIAANILALRKNGYIKADKEQIDFLVAMIALVARFWISEAAISYQHLTAQQQLEHYSALVGRVLFAYATAKGKKELASVLKSKSLSAR
jgi:AcrR family transcriptional regulator